MATKPKGTMKSYEKKLKVLKEQLSFLHDLALCVTCMERLREAAMCCVNGHAVCPECQRKIAACPTCAMAFSKEKHTMLSHLLEALPQICVHNGCCQVNKNIEDHEKWCGFRQVKCRECLWTGEALDVFTHVRSTHRRTLKFPQPETHWSQYLDGPKNSSMYLIAHNQCFWLVENYIPEEKKFVLQVTWIPDGSIVKNIFQINTIFEKGARKFVAVTTVHYDSLRVSACLTFHQDTLEPFIKEDGLLEYKMFITMD